MKNTKNIKKLIGLKNINKIDKIVVDISSRYYNTLNSVTSTNINNDIIFEYMEPEPKRVIYQGEIH
jgi:hypothetical protein